MDNVCECECVHMRTICMHMTSMYTYACTQTVVYMAD